ncbi:MAG: ABC transporter ATP-binding protein [Phycisphaerales bacterium]
MAAIETQSLTRRYGGRRGIEGVNLSVPEGSLFGFLGPNGAGKTTTIRVMLGLLRPTSGTAAIRGLDCWRESPRVKREVGYVPGDLRLYPWLNGRRSLRFVGAARGMDLSRHGDELGQMFDLDMSVPVRRMSRGMRQKLGLIMALAPEPRVLIMDEPTSALDPLMQDRLREHLRGLARRGHTVFFSSHTLGEVELLCDRIAIVREGRLVADASLDTIRRQAGRAVTIRWRESPAPPPEPPAFLRVTRRDGRTWVGVHEGPLDPLLAWLHGLPIEDLSIAPPDLETLFRQYYRPGGEGA